MQEHDAIDRRTFISRTAVTAGTLAVAGCADGDDADDTDPDGADDTEAVPEILEIEDRPDAVYVPTHREAMYHLEPIEAGDVAIAPMLAAPHPFWIVAGAGEASVERTEPEDDRGVHIMFLVWDRETGIVLPVDDGTQLRIERDGEPVGTPISPWTMISQGMGFHFGDNVVLPADGTYTAEVELPPLSTRTTGDLAGRFEETETATFEFTYDETFREEVVGGIEYFDEAVWGERGAIEPMDHGTQGDHEGHDDNRDIPYSALPAIDDYPGTILVDPDDERVPGETQDLPESGDARFLATILESDHRLAEDDAYLLVSPRTPYNRVPLADMSLSSTIERDDEVVADPTLEQTIDGEYGLHYGTSVSPLEAGDSVTIEVDSPPQVARHQGYETAFLEMPPVELTVIAQ